jgi:major membrane immunogen (membrane-anchored lipoprotein)
VIAERLVERQVLSPGEVLDKTVDILLTLSSFETFDTLAGPTCSMEEVAPLVYQLARAALKLDNT